jgi:glycosyltransferase involved in cell wall biosynthesis
MTASVSVLVPCFNASRWLIECVDSVRHQSFAALEIIIVDDGSDEIETLQILKTYKEMSGIRVLRKTNGGVSSARNAALGAAKGDYVLFLDADDYLEPHALGVMVAAAESSGAVFVGAGWNAVDESGRIMHTTAPKALSEDYYVAVATTGMAMGGVLTKRRVDIRFNDTTPWEAWEADEYFLDYLSRGEKAVFVDDIVVNRRQSDRPERLTNKLDHFEPMRTGTFFVGRKNKLLALSAASDERYAALDRRILSSIHRLLYANRYADAAGLAKSVSRNLPDRYTKYRLGSFAWCFKWGGIKAASFFVMINRLVGRG